MWSADNKEMTWKILGPTESDPTKGAISHARPIGSALIGKSVDEVVTGF